jgi:hypothetical protein
MPPPVIERKQGDTGPEVTFQILQDGIPANLTGATVVLIAKAPGATAVKFTSTLTAVNAGSGIYRYSPSATDFITMGEYDYELEITLSNGKKFTSPSSGYGRLVVSNDLNDAD